MAAVAGVLALRPRLVAELPRFTFTAMAVAGWALAADEPENRPVGLVGLAGGRLPDRGPSEADSSGGAQVVVAND